MLILSDDVENRDLPIVNLLLIAANVGVFIWMLLNDQFNEHFIRQWGSVAVRMVTDPGPMAFLTILTSTFMHSGIAHLVGNMWALWLFGDNVEDRLGHFTYLVFFITCGVFAEVMQILSDPLSSVPSIGASGAIAGVMGAYLVLHPGATCKTWWGDDSVLFAFRTYKVPAVLVIGGWFALQVVLCQITPSHGGGIAFYAHIGGFLAGIGMLMALRYREYQTNETVSYGGIMPAVCVACFITLGARFMGPYMGINLGGGSPSKIIETTAAEKPMVKPKDQPQTQPHNSHARAGHHGSPKSTVHATKHSSRHGTQSHQPGHQPRKSNALSAAPSGKASP